MENLKNKIGVRLVSNKKYYLKWTSKPSCMSQKIFDNDLVVTRKRKATQKLNEPAYVGLCIWDLSKVLMYELKINIKNKYGNKSKLLFTNAINLMYDIKTEGIYKVFFKDKNISDFSIIQVSQNIFMIQTS